MKLLCLTLILSICDPCGQLKRPSSAPLLNASADADLRIRADFNSIISELEVVGKLRQSLATRDVQQQQQQQQQAHQPTSQASLVKASQGSDTEAERVVDPHLLQARPHVRPQRQQSSRVRAVQEDLSQRSIPARRRGAKAGRKLRPGKLAEILSQLKEKPCTLLR